MFSVQCNECTGKVQKRNSTFLSIVLIQFWKSYLIFSRLIASFTARKQGTQSCIDFISCIFECELKTWHKRLQTLTDWRRMKRCWIINFHLICHRIFIRLSFRHFRYMMVFFYLKQIDIETYGQWNVWRLITCAVKEEWSPANNWLALSVRRQTYFFRHYVTIKIIAQMYVWILKLKLKNREIVYCQERSAVPKTTPYIRIINER